MKVITISAHYVCDVCEVETADTSGDIPSGWKEVSRIDVVGEVAIESRLHIGPVCSASADPAVIEAVAHVLLGIE